MVYLETSLIHFRRLIQLSRRSAELCCLSCPDFSSTVDRTIRFAYQHEFLEPDPLDIYHEILSLQSAYPDLSSASLCDRY
jgi:hypothetical protein